MVSHFCIVGYLYTCTSSAPMLFTCAVGSCVHTPCTCTWPWDFWRMIYFCHCASVKCVICATLLLLCCVDEVSCNVHSISSVCPLLHWSQVLHFQAGTDTSRVNCILVGLLVWAPNHVGIACVMWLSCDCHVTGYIASLVLFQADMQDIRRRMVCEIVERRLF